LSKKYSDLPESYAMMTGMYRTMFRRSLVFPSSRKNSYKGTMLPKINVNIGRRDITSQKTGIPFNTVLKGHKSRNFENSEYLTGHILKFPTIKDKIFM